MELANNLATKLLRSKFIAQGSRFVNVCRKTLKLGLYLFAKSHFRGKLINKLILKLD